MISNLGKEHFQDSLRVYQSDLTQSEITYLSISNAAVAGDTAMVNRLLKILVQESKNKDLVNFIGADAALRLDDKKAQHKYQLLFKSGIPDFTDNLNATMALQFSRLAVETNDPNTLSTLVDMEQDYVPLMDSLFTLVYYYNWATVLANNQLYEQAIPIYNKSLIHTSRGQEQRRSTILASLAYCHEGLEDYEKADEYHQEILQLTNATNQAKVLALLTQCNIASSAKDYQESLKKVDQALSLISPEHVNYFDALIIKIDALYNLQRFSQMSDNIVLAESFVKDNQDVSIENKFRLEQKRMFYEIAISVSDKTRFSLENYTLRLDSMYSTQRKIDIGELQIQYESEKKEAQNQLLASQISSRNATIRSQWYVLGLSILGLIVALLSALIWRQKKKVAEKRASSEEELRLVKEREAAYLSVINEELALSQEELKQANRNLNSRLEQLNQSTIQYSSKISLKTVRGKVRIDPIEIEYLKAESDGVRLFKIDGENVWIDHTLTHLIGMLPDVLFMQCFRGIIVNINRVDHIETKSIVTKGNLVLPLSRTYRKNFE